MANPHARLLSLVVGGAILVPVLILLFQSRLIYFPRTYEDPSYRIYLDQLTRVDFRSRNQPQTAFLLGEQAGQAPDKIWWCFGGNGALAADWMMEFGGLETPGIVFVLVDYPGYGYCGGRSSPKSIAASTEALQQLLETRWGLSRTEMSDRGAALGHSLGCAAALDLAAKQKLGEVVAISPFTTMREVAKTVVGGVLSNLLLHRFNNEKTLDQIVAQSPDASITIFHGTADEVIPFELGKALAGRHPDRVVFTPVDGAGHNDIVFEIGDWLRETVARR